MCIVNPSAGGQRGFTLIELLMVIAIIALLAGLALPLYQRYVIHAHMAEVLSIMAVDKLRLSNFRGQYGKWPTDDDLTAGEPPISLQGASEFLTADTFVTRPSADADVQLHYAIKIKKVTGTLLLTSSVNEGSTVWHCSSIDIEPKWLPDNCR